MFWRITMAILVASLFVLPAHAQSLSGRVFDAQSNRGIENLEVKLRPPNNSTTAVLIGNTDQNGSFRFSQVKPGRYLIEVSQGPYLLYRTEIDTSRQGNIDIPIQRR